MVTLSLFPTSDAASPLALLAPTNNATAIEPLVLAAAPTPAQNKILIALAQGLIEDHYSVARAASTAFDRRVYVFEKEPFFSRKTVLSFLYASHQFYYRNDKIGLIYDYVQDAFPSSSELIQLYPSSHVSEDEVGVYVTP